MKVWIVIEYHYEEQEIRGVFATREAAMKFRRKKKLIHSAGVEEYEVLND